ncbi:MAG: TlpA family protein disulfide reductase [Prevotellaceae bacterium]|jgi:peroxiredoxin|nr:TlpA family protein disulfide reductase [Prevotellaceae bacterium]
MRKILSALICLTLVYACSSSRQFSPSPEVAEEKAAYNAGNAEVRNSGDIIENTENENTENENKQTSTTQFLTSSIDDYFDNIVPQIPDSIIHALDSTLSKVENDTATMKFLTRYIFNKYLRRINSNDNMKMTGLENIVIHIIDNYYVSGKVDIDDAEFVAEIAEYANKNRATLIGQQAKNLKMETVNGGAEALYDIDSPYILLCFFDASCAHCRHEIPEIYKIFKKFKNKGLSGFCVYTRDDKKEWLEFITEYKLTDWINAWDPTNENDFRIAYSLYYIPQVYVLDKNKKIVGHRLESASLAQLLNQIIKNKDNQ